MNKGYLSGYFEGFAAKRLSSVEANPSKSNQHEFNGVTQLKRLLGTEKQSLNSRFLYLDDTEEMRTRAEGSLTWYDSRERNLTRTEFRLYFPSNDVTNKMDEGDLLIITKSQYSLYNVIVAPAGSTFESQLIWLFGISSDIGGFEARILDKHDDIELGFASRFILEELGLETQDGDDNLLDLILGKFGSHFPPTRIFSEFARSTVSDIDPIIEPDLALMTWIEKEEMLFRSLERHIVSKQLEKGFSDVDDFIGYSLSVQNRRKSRVGHALENHIEFLFKENKLLFTRGGETENKAKPDFLFPGVKYYHQYSFNPLFLTMLGVKSTCKDRWRQVLSEAQKIERKHLFTLEPGISENQTMEMKSHQLTLVLPKGLHQTFSPSQQNDILGLHDFIGIVKDNSKMSGIVC